MLTFKKPTPHIQVSPEPVSVENMRSGASVTEVPGIANGLGNKQTALAVGSQAQLATATQGARVVLCHHKRKLGEYEGLMDVDERLVTDSITATDRVAQALSA
ncbi:MAG: hypothetical protein QUV35_04770 [Hydrogenophaga sp.]|uniref:hypothetical protein n=1 Tax=Hydrogenophaga sp. TaxID=1904254 RepID=UPI00260D6D9D|nr:hypothetical protein [Hydrogenophaga sp.]MDM7941922.1 hypothetical protein [Hydrogenophaga sp.]